MLWPALAEPSVQLRFLDHDCAGHFGMNGAKVSISARRARGDTELLVCVERGRFLELLLDADNGVRFFVAIDPGNLLSGFHGDDLRIKGEVLDLDLNLMDASVPVVLHFTSECDLRDIEQVQSTKERQDFN